MTHSHVVMAKPTVVLTWNTYVASLSPYAWWKLDEDTFANEGDLDINDATGHGWFGTYAGDSTSPTRHTSALVTGSSFGVTTAATANLGGTHMDGLCNNNSFTFGCIIRDNTTSAANLVRRRTSFEGLSVFVNYASGASSGALAFYYDTGGADANSCTATGTGWNDNTPHLLLFEYDENTDRLAIWVDGTKVGDRARAGTKPTLSSATYDFAFRAASTVAGVEIDEYLFFDKVLSSGEHTALAAYV